MQSTKLLSCGG